MMMTIIDDGDDAEASYSCRTDKANQNLNSDPFLPTSNFYILVAYNCLCTVEDKR